MLRTRVVWTGVAGSPYYSTFYWNGNGGSLANAAQGKTIAWLTEWTTFLAVPLVGQVESEVAEISETSGAIVNLYDVPGSTSNMTNNATNPLPFQTQFLTTYGTTGIVDGRRVKGRCFLPGATEGMNVSGAGPSEVVREQVQAVFSSELGGTSPQLVVWSRKAGATFPVTSFQTNAVWSTLRSRRAD